VTAPVVSEAVKLAQRARDLYDKVGSRPTT